MVADDDTEIDVIYFDFQKVFDSQRLRDNE